MREMQFAEGGMRSKHRRDHKRCEANIFRNRLRSLSSRVLGASSCCHRKSLLSILGSVHGSDLNVVCERRLGTVVEGDDGTQGGRIVQYKGCR
jgi:hypothetical protein